MLHVSTTKNKEQELNFFISPSRSNDRLKLKGATGTSQQLPILQSLFIGKPNLSTGLSKNLSTFKLLLISMEKACARVEKVPLKVNRGPEASGDAEASPEMAFIAFTEGLGQPYPLHCHAARPRGANLPFSSISQPGDEKRVFFPHSSCLQSGHKPMACRIWPYRNAPAAAEPTPLPSPCPGAPGLFSSPCQS